MKRFVLYIFLCIGTVLILTACADKDLPPTDWPLPTVAENTVCEFPEYAMSCEVVGKVAYFLGEESNCIYAWNYLTGEKTVFRDMRQRPLSRLSYDDGKLWTYDYESRLLVSMTTEGEMLGELAMPELPEEEPYIRYLAAGCGLICAATEKHAWLIEESSGKTVELDLSKQMFEMITGVFIRDRNSVLIELQGSRTGMQDLCVFNRKGKKTEERREAVYLRCAYSAGQLYTLNGNRLFLYEEETGELQIMQNCDWDNFKESMDIAGGFWVSGETVAVWWQAGNRLIVYPRRSFEKNFTIFTSSDQNAARVGQAVELAGAENVYLEEYRGSDFLGTLQTKLLAGDSDFDLAYLSSEYGEIDLSNFLQSLLRKHYYVDLYQNETLRANLEERIPGVRRFCEHNGEFAFLPTGFSYALLSCNPDAADLFGHPDALCMEELWTLCDTLIREESDFSLFSSKFPLRVSRILLDVIKSRFVSCGGFWDEAVTEDFETFLDGFLTECENYRDAGVLMGTRPILADSLVGDFPFGNYAAYAIRTISVPDRLYATPSAEKDDRVSMDVRGFYFVNPYSER
ncbi:MAG: hypothetical protein IKX19_12910, partial [Clostridia bacterium]|nr:hypothetical protein [Clostridia bacterium]